jgi:hypothetical protein
VELAAILKIFPLTGKYLAIGAVCVSSFAIRGCVESTFTLASESKLPRSMTLPPGLTRADVSVILNLYAPMRGPDAKFVLTDRKGKELAEVKGKMKELTPSKYYLIVTEKGITEIITLKPYKEDENMEQNGIPVARFNVIDDPAIRKELLADGAGFHAN